MVACLHRGHLGGKPGILYRFLQPARIVALLQVMQPGFRVDAHADLGGDAPPQGGDVGPTHWNPQVRAWFSTTSNAKEDTTRRASLRSLGFGAALAVPRQGIFRGTASVVHLGDAGVRERVLRPDLAQSVGFSRSFALGGTYPNSTMGTTALMKQTLLDAEWYMRAAPSCGGVAPRCSKRPR